MPCRMVYRAKGYHVVSDTALWDGSPELGVPLRSRLVRRRERGYVCGGVSDTVSCGGVPSSL